MCSLICLNQELNKLWRRRWFESPSCSVWRHCNRGIALIKTVDVVCPYKVYSQKHLHSNDITLKVMPRITHFKTQHGVANTSNLKQWPTFQSIFSKKYFCILIQNSLKFFPAGPIDIMSALLRVMVWRWPGDEPLPETTLSVELALESCVQGWFVTE